MGERGSDESIRGGDDVSPAVAIDPSLDHLYRLLGDWRRRVILYRLSDSDTRLHSVSALASRIADVEDSSDRDITDIEIELRHKHLPKLEESGVIEYDPRSEVVVYSRNTRIESLLEWAQDHEIREE